MRFQIQDDIIRRALDFFGLRGVVPHEYEATILPSVIIGNLGQPAIAQQFSAIPDGNPIATVPAGESWRLLNITALHTQTGAAVASHMMLIAQLPGPTNLYRFPGFTDTAATPEQLRLVLLLNASANLTWRMGDQNVILPPRTNIFTQNFQGDGTLTMTGVLVYERLGERLVEVQ